MTKTIENIQEMRTAVDYLEVFNLSNEIKASAERASELSKQLQSDNLSEAESEKLFQELQEEVRAGSEAAQQRARIFARSGVEL